jgi:potassium/chloride transporter 9
MQSQDASFQARTARGDARALEGQSSMGAEYEATNPYQPVTNDSTPPLREHFLTRHLFRLRQGENRDGSPNITRRRYSGIVGANSLTAQMHNAAQSKKADGDHSTPKRGLGPRPIGGAEKLGMFSGVYVPTCLNVLSILMFLRFGFVLGQFCRYRYLDTINRHF